jgi:hypothetical protein
VHNSIFALTFSIALSLSFIFIPFLKRKWFMEE